MSVGTQRQKKDTVDRPQRKGGRKPLARQQMVLDWVRSAILKRPPKEGVLLPAKKIADELTQGNPPRECSAREVRTAIKTLELEDLVSCTPQGIVVRKPSVDEVGSVMGLRWAIESYAAFRLATMQELESRVAKVEEHQAQLRKLAQGDEEAKDDEFRRYDAEFHREILRQADRAEGIELLDLCRRKALLALRKPRYTLPLREAVVADHEKILEAIKKPLTLESESPHLAPEDRLLAVRRDIEQALRDHLNNAINRSLSRGTPQSI